MTGRDSVMVLAWLAAAAIPALAQDSEEEDNPGLTEYEIACMSCHGVEGRGDGPAAAQLSRPPADLTQIAKANGGDFPLGRVAEIIDGRAEVAAHGMRDMPVWGARYRATREPGESTASLEHRVEAQIAALAGYLRSIQER